MSLLDRYLGGTILKYTLLVMAVLLTLGTLFVFIEQQQDVGRGAFGVTEALTVTALRMPAQAFNLLPIGALIGALVGLGSLARGSELVVFRAAGVSVTRIAVTAAGAGFVLGLMMWGIGELLAPPLEQYARQLKVVAKFSGIDFARSGNAWVKDGNRILTIEQQSADQMFGGVYIYEFDADRHLAAMGRADSAALIGDDKWRLSRYAETRRRGDDVVATTRADVDVQSGVNPDFLGLAVTQPEALSIRMLYSYIQHLHANGLEAHTYEIAFWSRIARTVAVIVVCMLAVPFVFGPLRSAGAGTRTVIGILIGVTFLLMTRTLENSGEVYDLNPLLIAWLPTVLLAIGTGIAIFRTR